MSELSNPDMGSERVRVGVRVGPDRVRVERGTCPSYRESRNPDTTSRVGVRGVRVGNVELASWQPITHNPRTLIVTCSGCHRGIVNETNAMRRQGWRERSVGRHRAYLCGECAAEVAP